MCITSAPSQLSARFQRVCPSLDRFTSEDAQDQVARMPRQKGAHLITQLFNSSSLGEWYSHVAPFLMSFPT